MEGGKGTGGKKETRPVFMMSTISRFSNCDVLRYLDEKRRDLIFGLLVIAAALLVYANSLGNGFVTDDPSVILHNPVLQGSPLLLFKTIDTTSNTQLLPFYRPLTYLTFYAEGRLNGFNPFLMHLVNVILHAANAFLVYRLARSLLLGHGAALLAGLLFAVHPLNTESVNFIAGGRNTMLACFFVLAAYLMHRTGIVQNRISIALSGAALFLSGLLSKESAVMVLPFIMMQEIFAIREKGSGEGLKAAMRFAPYMAATAFYFVLRWMTLSRYGIQTSIIPGFATQKIRDLYIIPSLSERLWHNVYILPKYLLTVIWPASVSPRYIIPDDLNLVALPILTGWVCFFLLLAWLIKRGRSYATFFGLSWLLVFWMPVSGIFLVSSIEMADRYFYLPAIGLWIIAADQAVRLTSIGKAALKYVMISTGLILIVMAGLTVKRNLDWKSNITLFTRLTEQYPENPYGHYHLGAAYITRKGPNDLQSAEKEYKMALGLDPSMYSVYTSLGYIRLEQGDFEGALYYYSTALAYNPSDQEARVNRGITYEKLGRDKEALADYQIVLSLPEDYNIPGLRTYAEERMRALSRG